MLTLIVGNILFFTAFFICFYVLFYRLLFIFKADNSDVFDNYSHESMVIKLTMQLSSHLRSKYFDSLANKAAIYTQKVYESGYYLGFNDGYDVLAMKMICAVLSPIIVITFLFLMLNTLALPLLLALFSSIIGYIYPSAIIESCAIKRKKKFLQQLPNAIDILSVCAEAGMDFITSVSYVIKCYVSGPVTDEFLTMQRELEFGKSQASALTGISERMNIPDVTTVFSGITQAIEMGTPMATMLKMCAEEMRKKRALSAEEEAKKAVVKMTIPLLLLILPGVFIVLLGPVVRELAATLGTFR